MPPSEHNLNQRLALSPIQHAVDASAVIVVDDRTVRIENLDYDGNAPGKIYFKTHRVIDNRVTTKQRRWGRYLVVEEMSRMAVILRLFMITLALKQHGASCVVQFMILVDACRVFR